MPGRRLSLGPATLSTRTPCFVAQFKTESGDRGLSRSTNINGFDSASANSRVKAVPPDSLPGHQYERAVGVLNVTQGSVPIIGRRHFPQRIFGRNRAVLCAPVFWAPAAASDPGGEGSIKSAAIYAGLSAGNHALNHGRTSRKALVSSTATQPWRPDPRGVDVPASAGLIRAK